MKVADNLMLLITGYGDPTPSHLCSMSMTVPQRLRQSQEHQKLIGNLSVAVPVFVCTTIS